jgi:hypothetical protein
MPDQADTTEQPNDQIGGLDGSSNKQGGADHADLTKPAVKTPLKVGKTS